MRAVRGGFSILELVVVMAVVALLVALSLPAVTRTREAARRAQCTNNLRNIALGMTHFDGVHGRLPPSGSFLHDEELRPHHSFNWAVSILPFVEQSALFARIDPDVPLTDPVHDFLKTESVPAFACPADLSRSKKHIGDLSYAVNGGIGFTVHYRGSVRDCPVDADIFPIDLNGDGSSCSGSRADDDLDRTSFKMLGLFFLETVNTDVTKRHHALADVVDGTSQTFLVTDNVRVGFDPGISPGGFADSRPHRCAFYVGNPCADGSCGAGQVDFSRCNAGAARINSGLWSPEGESAVPNSFHTGAVNMAYADGHVTFLSESIDGAAYAALSSPQGTLLGGTPLAQAIVSRVDF